MGRGIMSWDCQPEADSQLLLISANGGVTAQIKSNLLSASSIIGTGTVDSRSLPVSVMCPNMQTYIF